MLDLQVVEMLIQAGAHLNHATSDGATPLMVATRNGHVSIAKVLLDAGASAIQSHATDGSTPLCMAIEQGNVVMARTLVAAGADVHGKRADGATPLSLASASGHLRLVRIFQGLLMSKSC